MRSVRGGECSGCVWVGVLVGELTSDWRGCLNVRADSLSSSQLAARLSLPSSPSPLPRPHDASTNTPTRPHRSYPRPPRTHHPKFLTTPRPLQLLPRRSRLPRPSKGCALSHSQSRFSQSGNPCDRLGRGRLFAFFGRRGYEPNGGSRRRTGQDHLKLTQDELKT